MLAKTHQHGFNLIELIVVVAIIAILVGLGMPSLQDTIDRNAVKAEATRIARSINYARSKAVNDRSRLDVTMQRKSASAAAKDWSEGWTIFNDDDL